MPDQAKTFMVEDARIIFRNFSGKETQFNTAGDRNFCVIIDQETADRMVIDGWNVRYTTPREEGDTPEPYVQVKVSYKNRPPRITLITSTARTLLDENTVEILDWADIRTLDLIARGFDWAVGDKTGTKAYLQSMFVTIEEDELERKYAVNDRHDLSD